MRYPQGRTELLQAALREARKLERTVGICLADVDNLKQVNDRYGHQAGDQALRRVAGLIVASVRPQERSRPSG